MFLLLLACTESDDKPSEGGDSGRPPRVDELAPTLELLSPEGGATVRGVYTLRARVYDAGGVASLSFLVDGTELSSTTAEPWTAEWDTTSLPNGDHQVVVVAVDASGNGAEASALVTVHNGGMDPGSVQILSPTDGRTVCGDVPIVAYTPEPEATMTVFIDGAEKWSEASAPYDWTWDSTGRADGEHEVAVVATFPSGESVRDRVGVTVDNSKKKCDTFPTAAIVSPPHWAYLSTATTVEVSATDDDVVEQVELTVDGAYVGIAGREPFTFTFDPSTLDDGQHVLVATAIDSANQQTSAQSLVVVDTVDPRVEITSPGIGDNLSGVATIEVSATDNLGVDFVSASVNGTSLGTDTEAPYTFTWDTTGEPSGDYTISVIAEDAAGNQGRDSVPVDIDPAPTIEWEDPLDGDVIGGAVTFIVSASDDGSVDGVLFSVDGFSLGQDTRSPFRLNWSTCSVTPGAHVLTATAVDDGGNATDADIDVVIDQALEVEFDRSLSTVDGTEEVAVYATDDEAVALVTWSVDGTSVATATAGTAAPGECSLSCDDTCVYYSATLDFTALSAGDHTLDVTVENALGETETVTDTFTVDTDRDDDGGVAVSWGGDDCDDDDATVYLGAPEACDGLDNDCDGSADEDFDLDNDGYYAAEACASGTDCDDDDASVNPTAADDCDGIDNDCDGFVDAPGGPVNDNAEFGVGTVTVSFSSAAWGNAYTASADMTLASFSVYMDPSSTPSTFSVLEADSTTGTYTLVASASATTSGAAGWYNSGTLGASLRAGKTYFLAVGASGSLLHYQDRSPSFATDINLTPVGVVQHSGSYRPSSLGDDPSTSTLLYQDVYVEYVDDVDDDDDLDGQTDTCGDCDDTDATSYTGASEACDGIDNDCDGSLPTDEADADADADGEMSCDGDCDDNDASRYLASYEYCDGIDNDCDGEVEADELDADGDGVYACLDCSSGSCVMDCDDADSATTNPTWYVDADGDGYGSDSTATTDCPVPLSYVRVGGDCDESDAGVNPGATDDCDGVDNDCNGVSDDGFDDDGDGWGDCLDCDEADAAVNPGEAEVCGDDVDNDCDGVSEGCRFEGEYELPFADYAITGEYAGDYVGFGGAAADFDGDGHDDLAVGAYSSNVYASDAGAVYTLAGPLTGDVNLGDTGVVRLTGESASDYAGLSVSTGADFDGDGLPDIVVGAYGDDDGGSSAGAVYVVPGAALSDGTLLARGYKLTGEASNDMFGFRVDAAGDLDGDGEVDVLVSAYGNDNGGSASGAAYVFSGPITAARDASLADVIVTGESRDDGAGYGALLGKYDLDGDGQVDLVVSATGDDDGASNAGAIYVLYGPVSSGSLSTADVKLLGAAASDAFGCSGTVPGDVDGDGGNDLVLGSYQNDDAGSTAGVFYLATGTLVSGAPSAWATATVTGAAASDYTAYALARPGDLDEDGHADVLVGAYGYDGGASNSGGAFLFYGPLSGTGTVDDANASFVGTGSSEEAGMGFVHEVDADGDGVLDVGVGARGNDTSGTDAGALFFFSAAN